LNVLILGEGAREHALGWKLREQKECESIFIHPGNAGTLYSGFENFDDTTDLQALIQKARSQNIQLVVIGPEALLEKGYADAFRKAGFLVVGPNQFSAQLETSKVFAKRFLLDAQIPTAPHFVFESFEALNQFEPQDWPWVLKLDGLAAGKGVVIAHSKEDVLSFSRAIWEHNVFGSGKHRVLVEAFLKGKEISYIGFCDGATFIPLETATDYKKVFDGDKGPNTGGMGAISPSPYFSSELKHSIDCSIIEPLLRQMAARQLDFKGILFIGLMVDSSNKPHVLEFNTRFGDPETQCVLPRLKSSLLSLLLLTAQGKLHESKNPEWDPKTSVYVVSCAEGYPGNPTKGDEIHGLDFSPPQTTLFFSGVADRKGIFVTQGGRVLGVGALGDSGKEAREKAYGALSAIHWRGMHFRKDIGSSL